MSVAAIPSSVTSRWSLTSCSGLQEQSGKAESLVRLYNGIGTAAEALGRLAGGELTGAQAEHLEEEAAAKVCHADHTDACLTRQQLLPFLLLLQQQQEFTLLQLLQAW